jgi:hypothetical protein
MMQFDVVMTLGTCSFLFFLQTQPCARLPMAVFGPKRSSLFGPMGEHQFREKMQR